MVSGMSFRRCLSGGGDIFSKSVERQGKADTMSASAKPCVHGFWRTWLARVGDPVMMRATVSLFIRKFTPGDVTSRRDVPFAVGVRGVYGNPTLQDMHQFINVSQKALHIYWQFSAMSHAIHKIVSKRRCQSYFISRHSPHHFQINSPAKRNPSHSSSESTQSAWR